MQADFILQPSSFSRSEAPAVTCLCPTYGRFEQLRDAVACFLLQDYPNKRLMILNDAPVPIRRAGSCSSNPEGLGVPRGTTPTIAVLNLSSRFATLGHKRQALLEVAPTPLVAHWDDDDLYLPWHLSACISALQAHPRATCAKPRAAWYAPGPRGSFQVRGPRHNVFEGQMVFERERALELGGYPPKVSGQARALLREFHEAGELHTWEPKPAEISYVYRWADGLHHISGGGGNERSHDAFGARNCDFGSGRPLIDCDDPLAWARARLADQFTLLANGLAGILSEDARRTIGTRLQQAISSSETKAGRRRL